MGEPRKIIRDYRFEPAKALVVRKAVIAEQQKRYEDDPRVVSDGGHRVIPPYYPRDGDLVGVAGASFDLLEATLTFPSDVPAGTAFNINTGVYFGGGPATVDGDLNVKLPPTGAAFADDGRIEITLNGQELVKGLGLGVEEAQWFSATQLTLYKNIHTGNKVVVRAPAPTPPA